MKLENSRENTAVIYTDGACSGNPGPGGWGAIVIFETNRVIELGGGAPSTTNNRMELTAAIEALTYLQQSKLSHQKIYLLTDSVYIIHGIQKWIHGWRKNHWQNAEGTPVLNQDLWMQLYSLAYGHFKNKIEYRYVRGHQGTPGNERCDEIAVVYSKNLRPRLYEGPLSTYGIAVIPLPPLQPVPENKNYLEKKKPAFSYLSLIGREIIRHQDWASCERRVKGQSGAKFKKAMSESDESAILDSWGMAGSIIKDDGR